MALPIDNIANTHEHDFSQFGEQAHITKYFDEHPNVPHYCIDVGAHDGVTGSNSRALFLRGWSGILIEPDPRTFRKVQELYADRADIRCIQRAVSTKEGEVTMRFCKGPPGTPSNQQWEYGQVNTLNDHLANYFIEHHSWEYEEASVRVSTLETILESVNAPQDVGFLSLDCEGEDMNIVNNFDFGKRRIHLVCIECEDASRYIYEKALAQFGYKNFAHTRSNTLFSL